MAGYDPKAFAAYRSLKGEVTLVVTDGRSTIRLRKPLSEVSAIADGIAPPPTGGTAATAAGLDELADTGMNTVAIVMGAAVLLGVGLLLAPIVARRRHS